MSNQPYSPSTQNVPFVQEAEEAVIGSVLINPSAFYTVSSFLKADDFFLLRNTYIWQAMEALMERENQLDYLTVVEQIRTMGRLDAIGGDIYIIGLFRNTPSSVHAELYARLVQRAAVRRKLMVASDEIRGLALNENMPVESIALEAVTRLDIALETHTQSNLRPVTEAMDEFVVKLDDPFDIPTVGIPTGYEPLDEVMRGCKREAVTVWAARPGMGKTAALLGVAINAARSGANVAVFPMEMPKEQIMARILSQETGLPLPLIIDRRYANGEELVKQDTDLIREAVERFKKMKGQLYIDDTPALDVVTLKAKLRRMHYQQGLDLVIIDHLGELSASGRFENDFAETTFKMEYIKNQIARDPQMRVPVQLAVQLNRKLEDRRDKRPMMTDLRQSGRIEEKADNIIFIYRDSEYNPNTEFPNEADFIIAKHRNGSKATVTLFFQKECAKFMNGAVRHIDLSNL
jgi:replicative DNA helicase